MENYPVHIEIHPKVHLIHGPNQARFPEANTLLVDDEIITLVDAGTRPDRVLSTLRDLGHKPSDLDRIVLTHYHTDHKGHASYLREVTECEVLCHPLSKDAVTSFDTMLKYVGIIDEKTHEDWMQLLSQKLPHAMNDYVVDGTFEVDKPINCGETSLLPLHSPGHTPDHTCFGIDNFEKVFLVDIDLTNFGPWYANETSDVEDFINSIQKIIDLEPTMGISSHLVGPITDGLDNRLRKYLSAFQERDERIIEHISKGINTVEKLAQVPIIYPYLPKMGNLLYIAFEELMLKKHIELLVKSEVVNYENDQLQLLKS